MDKIRFKEIMKERNRILLECQDDWGDGIDMCCKETIAIISEDIPGFIEYLKTDCIPQEYLFITEWFDEFVDEIGSQDLIDAFRETMNAKFKAENEKYNIKKDLDIAIKHYGKGLVH